MPPTHGKDGGSAVGIECQPTGIYTVADPEECNAYYQCDKGLRTRLNCPERQLFDASKRQCLEYERVFCGSRSMNLADKNQCKSFSNVENKFFDFVLIVSLKVLINVMEFIRIPNVIVISIINVLRKTKYAKRNVQANKNSAAIQANVVQRVMFPCHVELTFPEMLR